MNKIIISNHKGRLSDSQIKQMIDDAEKNKEEDLKFKKKVETKNELEAYALQMQSAVEDMQKMSVSDKKSIKEAVDHTISWLDENGTAELEAIQAKRKDLEKLCIPIVTAMYQNQ